MLIALLSPYHGILSLYSLCQVNPFRTCRSGSVPELRSLYTWECLGPELCSRESASLEDGAAGAARGAARASCS